MQTEINAHTLNICIYALIFLISSVHSYAASQHFFTATVGPTVTPKTSSTARKLQFHDPARAISSPGRQARSRE